MRPDVLERRIDALERLVCEQREEINRLSEREHGIDAEETMRKAEAFVRDNPEIWGALKAAARGAVEAGARFSTRDEIRRYKMAAVKEDGSHGILNAITPALTRLLVRDVDGLDGCVRMTRSKVDKYFPDLFGG